MTLQQASPGISVSRSGVTVEPVSGRIGAQITGIDISRPLDDSTVEVVRQALDTWKVVFFRGQKLDHASQIAFGRRFGSLAYAHPHDDAPRMGTRRSTPSTTAGSRLASALMPRLVGSRRARSLAVGTRT